MLVEKVQIAGAGVAGLAAGVALRSRGVEVEIHEQIVRTEVRRGYPPEELPHQRDLYWARNEVLGHTPDEKLLEIAEGMASDES